MIIYGDPTTGFPLCGTYPVCAVQDPGKPGGYFNNGMFIANPALHYALELIYAWWKPNAPFRQICLQDIMNEVYTNKWKALPEGYNHQGLKHGHYHDTSAAIFVHYKGCLEEERKQFPACQRYLFQRKQFLDFKKSLDEKKVKKQK